MSQFRFEDNKNKRLRSFKKAFYVSLAGCIVAVAAVSWTTARNNLGLLNDPNPASGYSLKTESDILGVDKPESGVKATSPSSASSKEDAETAKKPEKEFFMTPLMGKVYKLFSGDTLIFSPTFNDFRAHNGIDIECAAATPVKSVSEGEVVNVKDDMMLGTVVEVRHGDYIARYCGLNKKPPVKEGDILKIGDVVGVVDVVPSELTEQPHLHFEVLKDGKHVDPVKELGFKTE